MWSVKLGGVYVKKHGISILVALAVSLLASSMIVRTRTVFADFPTSDTPALLTSLSPPNATIGQNVTWLIWTDVNCSGCLVDLEIVDETNSTTIFKGNGTLGILHECGSMKKEISTAGYSQHEYRFTAEMSVNGMKMISSKYLDLHVVLPTFSIYTYTSPYKAIPGDDIGLTIWEGYPYVDAVANVTVYNGTHASLWTASGRAISSTNGSQEIDIPTVGLVAGFYYVNTTATSAVGNASSTTSFTLVDIMVSVDEYSYYIGDLVNVSMRTYTSISQAGLQIFLFGFPPVVVVDEYVLLTGGKGSKLYDSSGWSPAFYSVSCNVTIGARTSFDYGYFSLIAFDVDVETDKYSYVAGERVNITTSTNPPQPSAIFNLAITNSTDDEVWSDGPSNLGLGGNASVLFNTAGLPPDDYTITAVVNNTHYEETGYGYFEIPLIVHTFDILADISPYSNTGYSMPRLNTTVVPGQTNANLTIEVSRGGTTYYSFTKDNFDVSTYIYFIPAVALPNGSYTVDVSVTSLVGTNSTGDYFYYANGIDADGDGLSDSAEQTLVTEAHNPDTDGDGFFDGMEVYHGSDPLDPLIVIPESSFMQAVILACTTPLLYLIAKRRARPSKRQNLFF